jgi:hypothetical protein
MVGSLALALRRGKEGDEGRHYIVARQHDGAHRGQWIRKR